MLIVDQVATDLVLDEARGNLYCLPQGEVNGIESILNGGDDSDIDMEEVESGDLHNEHADHPPRVTCSTRSGWSAMWLKL